MAATDANETGGESSAKVEPRARTHIPDVEHATVLRSAPLNPLTSKHLGSAMREEEVTYSEGQIVDRLNQLPGWFFEDGWIRRNYKTDGWPTTLMLVNTIG